MKKKIGRIILLFSLVLSVGVNVYISHQEEKISDLTRANIEALANEENSGNQLCFVHWRKAPDDGSLALWDWICSECEPYWLIEGSIRSYCN